MVDFCMSHAAVGQRSAHSPQCTHRSSSLTMTREVCGRAADTYSAWVWFLAGACRRVRRPHAVVARLHILVNGNRGLMPVLDGPDDVLGSEGRVAAEVNALARGTKGVFVDDRHAPLVELDAEIALDPRKGVFLADREN